MRRIAITAVAVLAGVACGEYASPPESIVDPVAARAPTPPECDTKAAIDLMRAWFPRDLRRDAAATIRDLGDACAAEIRGDEATDLVFALVTVMEQIADEGTATGTPADGAALLNELLSFGAFGCGDSCAVPAAVFAAGGTLGVRFPSDESPLISVGPSGLPQWTLEPPGTWGLVLPTDEAMLFYGYPGTSNPDDLSKEIVFSVNAFVWEKLPDVAFRNPDVDQPTVGYCGDDLGLPNPTIERISPDLPEGGSTLLQGADPQHCDGAPVEARNGETLGTRLAQLATWMFGPQELAASLQSRTGVGGKPRDFSSFVGVSAVSGGLAFTDPQPTDQELGEDGLTDPFDLTVQALSDNGTPIENLEVEISAEDNNGAPVILTGMTASRTVEVGGVARFTDLQLNKAGGYRLRVTAVGQTEGFVILDALSDRITVRGN